MRYLLLATLLAVGAGCQTFGDRGSTATARADGKTVDDKTRHKQAFLGMMNSLQDSDAKKTSDASKKDGAKTSPDPLKLTAAHAEAADSARGPSSAPEVLLVPKIVYVPYSAQAPLSPVKQTSATMSSAEVPAQFTAPIHRDAAASTPTVGETNQLLLVEVCKKLDERLDAVERKLGERERTVVPPPPAPLAPLTSAVPVNAAPPVIQPINPATNLPAPPSLYRRPLCPNGESLQPCESCPIIPGPAPAPMSMK